MDLWIRTQKRLDIFKVNNIQIMGCDICAYTADGNYTLGEYDSNDRALEVLDEIEATLKIFSKSREIFVYEMPKE